MLPCMLHNASILREQPSGSDMSDMPGDRERLLALYVHPNARQAQKLYEDCGFVFAPGRFLPDLDIHPDDADGLFGMDYVW